MQRRTFLNHAALLSGATLLPAHRILAHTLFAAGEMHPLRRNIGYYTERGGTIGYLLTAEHMVVVDTQFPEQAGNLLTELREMNEGRIDLLINTHHHHDHTGGNIAFKGLVNMHVAHENARANQERVAHEGNELANQLLPASTFSDEFRHRIGDETLTLRYWGPAHTDGDAVTHFEEANVVHMGDLVFNRRFPYIDKSAGASVENWALVLEKAFLTFDNDTIFIFGHAGEGHPVTGTRADLKAMQNYLEQLLTYVQSAVRAGQTLDELKAATTGIPGAPEWQGNGVVRSLDAAWMELTEGK
ncbi:MAG: MBL fold metallo-hydrolase [Lewinella sp.]|nr:MBL fold metallo-hydrolase [Lewinella sp.]